MSPVFSPVEERQPFQTLQKFWFLQVEWLRHVELICFIEILKYDQFYSTTETARMEWKNEMRHNSSHLHVYRCVCINLLHLTIVWNALKVRHTHTNAPLDTCADTYTMQEYLITHSYSNQ